MLSCIAVLVGACLIEGRKLGNKGSIRAEHLEDVADMTQSRRSRKDRRQPTYTETSDRLELVCD